MISTSATTVYSVAIQSLWLCLVAPAFSEPGVVACGTGEPLSQLFWPYQMGDKTIPIEGYILDVLPAAEKCTTPAIQKCTTPWLVDNVYY